MALVFADCVRDTTTTTGSGQDIALDGSPPTGSRLFSDKLAINDTCYAKIDGRTTGQWEIRLCSLTSAYVLSAGTVIASSNADTAVNFVAGTKDVYLTFPATYASQSIIMATPLVSLPTTAVSVDVYAISPITGKLASVDFSGSATLATSDSAYLTFSITNLGQSGAGSTAMLDAGNANTTKATGGTAITANTKRSLTLHGTAGNLLVAEGDRLKISATGTSTPGTAVTYPVYLLRFLGA